MPMCHTFLLGIVTFLLGVVSFMLGVATFMLGDVTSMLVVVTFMFAVVTFMFAVATFMLKRHLIWSNFLSFLPDVSEAGRTLPLKTRSDDVRGAVGRLAMACNEF